VYCDRTASRLIVRGLWLRAPGLVTKPSLLQPVPWCVELVV
jgi:hypothetical protein